MSIFAEFRRRNVFKVAAAYIVVAWVIVQAAVTLRELFPDVPIWVGQALLVFLILGIVPVAVFSWYYELTPEGFRRDEGAEADRSYTEMTNRRLVVVTVVLAFVGLGLFIGSRVIEPPDPPVPQIAPNSVVVLPFVNMSGDPDNEYFSDGLTETIGHMLDQVKNLRVIAPTTGRRFKDTELSPSEIADQLGVANLLQGSVQRSGDRVRITAKLVRGEDGDQVWSENYDRTLNDIFAIQDEIASAVGVALLATLLNPSPSVSHASVGTVNFEAYDFYLRAMDAQRTGSFEAMRNAEALLRSALDLDPGFIEARLALADLILVQFDSGMIPFDEGYPAFVALVDQVLADNPDQPRARMMKIRIRQQEELMAGRHSLWQELESEARAVLAEAPGDVQVRMWFAGFISRTGGAEEAARVLENTLPLDPLNAELRYYLANYYSHLRQLEEAKDLLRQAVELEPDATYLWGELASVALKLGDGRLAIDSFLRSRSLDREDHELPEYIAAFLYHIGLPREARAFHDEVVRMAPDSEAVRRLAMLRAFATGDMDAAVARAKEIIPVYPFERPFGWYEARALLMFTAVERGTEAEDLALLEEQFPGLTDPENLSVEPQAQWIRALSFDVLRAVNTDDEILRYVETLRTQRGIFSPQPDRYPRFPWARLEYFAVTGDVEGGVQWALDKVFTRAVTECPFCRLQFDRQFLAPIMNDPRVRKARERWERQEAEVREDVRAYLAERSSGD